MKKIVTLTIICWCLLSCNKENKTSDEIDQFDFTLHHIDTLSSETLNKIFFEYSNKEFENFDDRKIEVLLYNSGFDLYKRVGNH